MAELLGQTLGTYRIETLIGKGATGDVYRASHIYRAQRVAIKVLRSTLAADPTFPARFVAEMRGVAALRHRNIIEIADVGEQDGRCYLVMELVTAGSLRTLIRKRLPGEPTPLALALDLASQTAEALTCAHEKGIFHKDLKPNNLLLNLAVGKQAATGGDTYTAKVADFGLATLAQGSIEQTSIGVMLGTGSMLGAPAYMAPEQCQGKQLDGRTDLYSLGIMLYELVTGYLPFQATTLRDAVREHVYTAPPLPRMLVPTIPMEVERIILRCLAKKPDDRYDTATDLAHALQAAMPIAWRADDMGGAT
jgi:serine/threonine protein kinase